MAPKVLLIAGDASEDLEVMYPLQRLREEGYEVDVAAKSVKPLQLVVHDFVAGFDTFKETAGRLCPATIALADVPSPASAAYAALVVPGGRAPEYLRNDAHVRRIVAEMDAAGRPIAHLCHGGLVLAAAGVLKGRRAACFPEVACDLTAGGAAFVDAEVVVDGNQVSARAWPDHPAWMREFMKLLRAQAPAS
ncbi:hypothetical protein KEM52_003450 [Ascosphaera acerosa]|nr:hypothetical protein KEM52_003450 [Ascosphaera acerosa]